MSMRSKATRLGALIGAAALIGGLALSASGGSGVHAQTGGSATATPTASAGGPAPVPATRFFGAVTVAGSAAVDGTTVTASIGGTLCGSAQTQAGQYILDIQGITGCTTPGAAVSFTCWAG